MSDETQGRSDWAYLLASYKNWIVALALLIIAGVLYFDVSVSLPGWSDVPRSYQLVVVYGIRGVLYAWIVYGLMPSLADLIESLPYIGKTEAAETLAYALRLEWITQPEYDRFWESDVNRGFHKAGYDVPPDFEIVTERGKPFRNDAGEYCTKRLEKDDENERVHCWFHWPSEVSDEELEQFEYAQQEMTKRQDYQVNKAKSVLIKLPWMLRNMEQKITERLARQTVDKSTDSVETYDSELIRSVDKWSDDGTIPEDYMSDKYQQERQDGDDLQEEAEDMLDDMTDGAVEELKAEVDGKEVSDNE